MTEPITKEGIWRLLQEWRTLGDIEITEEGHAYSVEIESNGKKFAITTPYEVREFFVDFYVNGEAVFSDWFEAGEDESLDDFMTYSEQVATRFLNHEVRVRKHGWLFSHHVLEFKTNERWRDVFA